MRKTLALLLLFCIDFGFAQKLDFKLLDQLTQISFLSIDKYMTEGYGFELMQNEPLKRIYARNYNNDYDNAIIINVVSAKNQPNILDVLIAKNYNVQDIKDKLISLGYEYTGSNDYGFNIYEKEKSTYLISKEPNKAGASQLMIFTEW